MNDKRLKKLLETPFFPEQLEASVPYTRDHDDTDGKQGEILGVTISGDGDAWVFTGPNQPLRFRTDFGGGRSPRTRIALLILAEAIRLDNQEERMRFNQK